VTGLDLSLVDLLNIVLSCLIGIGAWMIYGARKRRMRIFGLIVVVLAALIMIVLFEGQSNWPLWDPLFAYSKQSLHDCLHILRLRT
jgi:hypothetical protein